MPLVNCPSCKRRLSTEATTCPKCGHPLPEGWGEEAFEKVVRQRFGCLVTVAVIVGVIVALSYCSSRDGGDEQWSGSTSNPTALEMMEVTFVGHFSQAEIKTRVDKALSLYDLPKNDEYYSRAASMLIGLRRETGVPEMSIIQCVNAGGLNQFLDISEAAGIRAATLEQQ